MGRFVQILVEQDVSQLGCNRFLALLLQLRLIRLRGLSGLLLGLWLRLLGRGESRSRGVDLWHLRDHDRIVSNFRNLVAFALRASICRLHLGVLLRISIELLPSALRRLGHLIALSLRWSWDASGRSTGLHV